VNSPTSIRLKTPATQAKKHQSFQNKLGGGGWHKVYRQLLCLVLEISTLLSFLHTKLSNKVIFPQPDLLYGLKTTYYFLKPI
jgi:hypothetical protein